MPLPATLFAPDYLTFENVELKALLNTLRDPLCIALYFLITTQADFKTGELVTNYPRLIELCTPPAPERGRRLPGPSLEQVRRALRWLEGANMVKRNTAANEAQGTLRLRIRKRKKPEVISSRPTRKTTG